MSDSLLKSIINHDVSFKQLNTFNLQGSVRYFVEITDIDSLLDSIEFANQQSIPLIVLGGGSNVLLSKDINGLIVHMAISGVEVVDETDSHIYLRVGAGVNWHEFVLYCLNHYYYGIENLSLIPGTVGAAPIQNIGAYGVELKDVFHELTAYDFLTKQNVKFNSEQCTFSYRNSIFKKIKDRYIVTHVTLRLNKNPQVVLTDKSVLAELDSLKLSNPTPDQMSEIICNIRRRKLPYDKNIGNAGSFFMNPFTSKDNFIKIKNDYPNVIGFPVDNNQVKVGAGWMIDQCGWKGFREGDVGVYEHNALVLVNYGNAKGQEILSLADKIKKSVYEKFHIELEMEPRVY